MVRLRSALLVGRSERNRERKLPQGLSYAVEPDSPWRKPVVALLCKLLLLLLLAVGGYALVLASGVVPE